MKYLLIGLFMWLLAPLNVAAQTLSPLGIWVDESGESHIELYKCGEKMCGRVVWMQQGQDPQTGRPKQDQRNPNPDKRSQALLNLVVIQNLEYNAADDRWDGGEIYDPHNGRTYSCFLRMAGKDRLEVKGYIGFAMIGRSHYWSRLPK